MKLALFAYNFPHKKTQDFVARLLFEGYKIDLIIAADPVKLNIAASAIKTKIRHTGLVHPSILAKNLNIPYFVANHNSPETIELVKQHGIDVGVIAGARILKANIIDAFTKGVINYHPGLIPESRGLDAMLWSIHNDVPLGVTSHLIDRYIDAGKILEKRIIPLYIDDTIFDVSERLYEVQLDMLATSIEMTMKGEGEYLTGETTYNKKMEDQLEFAVLKKFPQYLETFVGEKKVATV